MNLKINNMLSFFKNSNGKRENINFLKHKNLILVVFAVIFAALISTIILFFATSEKDLNFYEKRTVELPFKDPLDEDDLNKIKDVSINELQTCCYVQKTIPLNDEYGLPLNNKLTISFYEKTSEDDEVKIQDKVENLISKIKEDFPDAIQIKNKEEILINTETKADIEDFFGLGEILVVFILLLLIALYLFIAYRKLNGFLVISSFLSGFIFNLAFVLALFFGFSLCFDLEINNTFLLPIAAVTCLFMVNFLLNMTYYFRNLREIVINKDKEKMFLTASNEAINESFSFFSGNFIILAVIPTISFVIFSVLNYFITGSLYYLVNIMPFILIAFLVVLSCFLTSIYLIPSIYNLIKRKKA